MQTMIDMYNTYIEAEHVVMQLEAMKVPHSSVAFMALNGHEDSHDHDEELDGPATASLRPAEVDAHEFPLGQHLDLASIGGIGPVIWAGWMVEETLRRWKESGRNAGDMDMVRELVECLVEHGATSEEAKIYMEGVRQGAALVGVTVDDDREKDAVRIMRQEHKPLTQHVTKPKKSKTATLQRNAQKTKANSALFTTHVR